MSICNVSLSDKEFHERLAKVYETSLKCSNSRISNEFGIASGSSGIAMSMHYLYEVTLIEKYRELSYRYFFKTLSDIKATFNSTLPLGVFSGLSGVLHVLSNLPDLKNRYEEISDPILAKIIMDLPIVVENYEKRHSMLAYDCIAGVSGILYILSALPSSEKRSIAMNYCISYLVEKFNFIGNSTTGYEVLMPNRLGSGEAQFGLNIGISHGMSGVIVALSSISRYEVLDESVTKVTTLAIQRILEIIVNRIRLSDDLYEMPYLINSNYNSEILSPITWCYGLIGFHSALQKSKCLLDTDWTNKILFEIENYILMAIETRRFDSNLKEPSICHGYAGQLLFLDSVRKYREVDVHLEIVCDNIDSFGIENTLDKLIIDPPDFSTLGYLEGIAGIVTSAMHIKDTAKSNYYKRPLMLD